MTKVNNLELSRPELSEGETSQSGWSKNELNNPECMALRKNPFDADPGSEVILSQAQKEALSRMTLVVESKTLGVLTGEVGSGKSTILRLLAASLSPIEYQLVYLSSAGLSPKDLYDGLLKSLGENPAYGLAKVKQQFQEVAQSRRSGNSRQIVALIDEAHELSDKTLLELRFLMCQGLERPASLFPIVLAGQSKLRRELRKSIFESIAQRVRMQFHLSGMSMEECVSYVNARMDKANLSKPVFTQNALTLIHACSRGIPRVINLLCAHSLHAVQARGENAIEEKHVLAVIADLDKQRGA